MSRRRNAEPTRTIWIECPHTDRDRKWKLTFAVSPWPKNGDWSEVQVILFAMDRSVALGALDRREGRPWRYRWRCDACATDVELSPAQAQRLFLEVVRSGESSLNLRELAATIGSSSPSGPVEL